MSVIADITCGKEPRRVPMRTSGEDATSPGELEKIFKYAPTLIFRDEPAHQEECGCTCTSKSRCDTDCECVDSHGFFYDERGDLQIEALPPLHCFYECSPACGCSPEACRNRTTQSGVQLELEVRASKGGHGYGLYARQEIRKGAFVCLYSGEVIDSTEARRRWREQSENSQGNYILVTREVTAKATWTTIVDPTHRGNVGRFINHACPPLTSLIILPVRPAGQMIPQPALFAGRDIASGEELSFDYADASGALWTQLTPNIPQMETLEGSRGNFKDLTDKLLTKCLCGSPRCRGYMPFELDL